MTEPFDASLSRLRQARTSVANADVALTSQTDPVTPASLVVGSPPSGHVTGPPITAVNFAAAAAGQQSDFADDVLAKPRIGLAPRVVVAVMLALLALGGGVAVAYGWTATHSAPSSTVVIGTDDAELATDSLLAGADLGGGSQMETPNSVTSPAGALQGVVAENLTATAEVVVHMAGEVATPGIVSLPAGSRVADAVELAGGATVDAELAAVNLARYVVDGEQILVPKVGEVVVTYPGQQAAATPQPAGAGALGGAALSGAAPGGFPPVGAAPASGSALINLNTADSATLQQLPGIGPAIAGRIINWRAANGAFRSVSELQEVKGIGPAIMGNINGLVTVW